MTFWKDFKIVAHALTTVDVKEDFLGIWVGLSMLAWNVFRLLFAIALFLTLPVSAALLTFVVQHVRKQQQAKKAAMTNIWDCKK